SSRLSASSASPRRIRSTTSVFRRDDQRPRSGAVSEPGFARFMDASLPGHHARKSVSKKTLEQRSYDQSSELRALSVIPIARPLPAGPILSRTLPAIAPLTGQRQEP